MYDPERDEVPTRRYSVRLALIALTALAVGGALLPAFTGYRAGGDGQESCIAIRDAWSSRSAPTAPAASLGFVLPVNATPAQRSAYQQQLRAYYARPDVKAAMAYTDWLDGAGACLAGARHRLFLSAGALGVIGIVGCGTLVLGATRRRTHVHANEPASLTSA